MEIDCQRAWPSRVRYSIIAVTTFGESEVAWIESTPKKLGDVKAARNLLVRADTDNQAANRS
jgi:hypothetical protein